ncbi:MAG: DUF1566 domain-containing protein [Bradyrhizobium sp.]|uniref:Lcl C-terminal domain-containing protein n=1 Tax=Bradyrhizobium sp. TaxID=376 RepID=UPI003D09A790
MSRSLKKKVEAFPAIGEPHEGGYFGGRIRIGDQVFAIIVAPKAEGQHKDCAWNRNTRQVEGALSYCDGLANTRAMAEAGSKLAQWAQGLDIDGYTDWYLPSQDELEVLYRNLKPTTNQNWCYARSGINLNAEPPTPPYSPDLPAQTGAEMFRAGADQAFDETWYWSSTQHVSHSDYAWAQYFDDGNQVSYRKNIKLRARAVRRSPI